MSTSAHEPDLQQFNEGAANNQRAWRDTLSTVSTLTTVGIVMALALYLLSDSRGPLSMVDNLIGTLAYIAAFVLPLLVLGLVANLITLFWCWPRRGSDGDLAYRPVAQLRRRRGVAYVLVVVLVAAIAGWQYLRYWLTAAN